MKNNNRKYALISGIALIIMGVAAAFSFGFVYAGQIKNFGFAITINNLLNLKPLYTGSIIGWIVIIICDLIVTLFLYKFFRQTTQKLALVTSMIRLIYTIILIVAVYNLIAVLPLINVKNSNSLNEINSLFLKFEHTWSIGLIIFGFHLVSLGYISNKSHLIPKLFGILLWIAGISYILVHSAREIYWIDKELITDFEKILSLPMAIGEIFFAIWLIIRGGRTTSLDKNATIQITPK